MHQQGLALKELRVTVGLPPDDLPFCRHVKYSLSLIDERGGLVQRESSTLEYGELLADPEQVPWLVARALQTLFREGKADDLPTKLSYPDHGTNPC